jgi:predicted amidophosphoribosyltransferase
MALYEFCPRCGMETYDAGFYCPDCGLNLDRVARGPPKTQDELEEMR